MQLASVYDGKKIGLLQIFFMFRGFFLLTARFLAERRPFKKLMLSFVVWIPTELKSFLPRAAGFTNILIHFTRHGVGFAQLYGAALRWRSTPQESFRFLSASG